MSPLTWPRIKAAVLDRPMPQPDYLPALAYRLTRPRDGRTMTTHTRSVALWAENEGWTTERIA